MQTKLVDALNIEDLSAYLSIPKGTLCNLVREGKISSQKIGRPGRFGKEAIDRRTGNGAGREELTRRHEPGKMVREDQPWYPPRATREAIANAICHRDYTIPGSAVAVAMYDDHLEITNPGTFHFGITWVLSSFPEPVCKFRRRDIAPR